MTHGPNSHVSWKIELILSRPKNVNCLSVLKKMILRSRYISKIRDLRTQIVLYIKIFRQVPSGSKIFIEDIIHIHQIRSILWKLNHITVHKLSATSSAFLIKIISYGMIHTKLMKFCAWHKNFDRSYGKFSLTLTQIDFGTSHHLLRWRKLHLNRSCCRSDPCRTSIAPYVGYVTFRGPEEQKGLMPFESYNQ